MSGKGNKPVTYEAGLLRGVGTLDSGIAISFGSTVFGELRNQPTWTEPTVVFEPVGAGAINVEFLREIVQIADQASNGER